MNKALARVFLGAISAFVLFVFYVPLGHSDYTGRWGDGTYGANLGQAFSADTRVSAVDANSAASVAGVRVGDVLAEKPFSLKWTHLVFPHAGDTETYTFLRGGRRFEVVLTARPVPGFGLWERLDGVLAIVPATVFFIIAFVLVFLRPSVMTWSFFAYAIGYFSTNPSYAYFASRLPEPAFIALTFIFSTFCGNFAVLPLLPFIIRFPDDKLDGFRKSLDRLLWAAIAVAFAAYTYQWYEVYSGVGIPVALEQILDVWLPLAGLAMALLILSKKVKHAPPERRQRFGFLLIGVVVSILAYAVYFVPAIPRSVSLVLGYAVVIMPLCVAYAVFRHRVLDVNFVLNRTLTYGILSVLVIAFVSFLDWALGHVVSGQRFTTGVELAVTIAIGFLLDRINKVIERIVEGVFFRARRVAEEYLKRAATALPYATEESAVTDGLVQVPVDALELSAAALYRRSTDGARFEGIATSSNTTVAPSGFDRNHLLVRMLQAEEERVWLDPLRSHLDSENAGIYVLAVPVTVRHELVSFTLYGAHANGSQVDPEEVALLDELAREAARAYDHIEAVRTRERYAKLTAPMPGIA